MFREGNLEERYEDAVFVCSKTKKIARLVARINLCLILCLVLFVACASNVSNSLSVGSLIIYLCLIGLGYCQGYIMGAGASWTYYWLQRKFHLEYPILLTLLLCNYTGLFVWLIYRKSDKKIEIELRKNNIQVI